MSSVPEFQASPSRCKACRTDVKRWVLIFGAWLALVSAAFFVVHTTVHAHDDRTHVNCVLCQLSNNATPAVSGATDLDALQVFALAVLPAQSSLSVEAAGALLIRGPPALLL